MKNQYDLCGACAEQLKVVDNKVTCSNCGRRRYGASYELTKKEAKK